jgi:hypothetical protein
MLGGLLPNQRREPRVGSRLRRERPALIRQCPAELLPDRFNDLDFPQHNCCGVCVPGTKIRYLLGPERLTL